MHRSNRLVSALLILAMLFVALFLAACGSNGNGDSGSANGKLTPVDFQLSWLPGGENSGFFVGEEKGFYAQEGIDLNIKHSNDPTLSIKLVASGERPMGIAYTGDILFAAAKGENVTSVYTLTKSSPFGLVALKDSGIKGPKDLVGKRVGVTSLPTDQAYFDNMLKEAGVNKSDVEVVDPGQGGVDQIIQGNLDATSALVEYEPIILDSQGYPDHTFIHYSDYGAPDAPFYDIVVNPDWLKDHGDVVRGFLRATRKSFEWTSAHTAEAADIFVKQFPEQDPKLVAKLWTAERAVGGDGSHNPAAFKDLATFFEQHGLLEKPVDVTQLYTDKYQSGQGG